MLSSILEIEHDFRDRIIINYLSSVLCWNLQIKCVKSVLAKAYSGYMIINSGHTNLKDRWSGRVIAENILSLIPIAAVLEGNFKISKDNYVTI